MSLLDRAKRQVKIWALRIPYLLLCKVVSRTNSVCYISFPDVDGNALAYFLYNAANSISSRKIIWLVSDPILARRKLSSMLFNCGLRVENLLVVRKNTPLGFWLFLRSKSVFFTHGHYGFVCSLPNDLKLVNLWHGMPLKAIGFLDSSSNVSPHASDVAISSSPFFSPILAKAFGVDERRILITGLPRCDSLFSPNEKALQFKRRHFGTNTKLIVWLPTYQLSNTNRQHNDSNVDIDEIARRFVDSATNLSAAVGGRDIKTLVKFHPMDALNDRYISHIDNVDVYRSSASLFDEISLYDLLSVADGLISDASSVCFDFIATGKPILVDQGIFDVYSRSLCFDPEELFREVFTCRDLKDIDNFIEAVLALSPDASTQRQSSLFSSYADAHSCLRLDNELQRLASSSSM